MDWLLDWQLQLQNFTIVGIAGVCGGIIGLEREISGKPAGLRTHIFVAASSALLMLLGLGLIEDSWSRSEQQVVAADPVRIIQAIIVGISFLGAGTIIHEGGVRVEGLTTAASILLTAAIGIAVAMHWYLLAFGGALAPVLVLAVVGRIEEAVGWTERRRRRAEPPAARPDAFTEKARPVDQPSEDHESAAHDHPRRPGRDDA